MCSYCKNHHHPLTVNHVPQDLFQDAPDVALCEAVMFVMVDFHLDVCS